jgi:hypothetical protein
MTAPPHGPVTPIQTHEAAQTTRVNGCDILILAGFSVDPETQAFIQKAPIKSPRVHFANVNPDVLVGDLFKTSRASQLLTLRLTWYKNPGHTRGMRSSPHFSNWLGMTIAGIEWKQSEVVFNCPQNAVMSICFCNLSGLHHVSQENGIDSLSLLESF